MAEPQRPISRDQFRVAIICALPREADAMDLLFDCFWDEDGDTYGRAPGDGNVYSYGRIAHNDVVLVTLPNMGTTSAASACAGLRSSFRGIVLALLVGICGGVPAIQGHNAFLGDVVISSFLVQYDYGKQYPGRFAVKDVREDTLGRAGREIRSILAHVKTERGRRVILQKAAANLLSLQQAAKQERRRASYGYPGIGKDHLFRAGYTHKHQGGCDECANGDAACDAATKATCADIKCDAAQHVKRPAREEAEERGYVPDLFVGRIGSGNTVMKSGIDRDSISKAQDLIAFEMEGAGAWDEVPCLVVKGICDYADSHKDKEWQDFAAATAASVARALVERYVVPVDNDSDVAQGAPAREASGFKPLPTSASNVRSISNNSFGAGAIVNQGDISGGNWGNGWGLR